MRPVKGDLMEHLRSQLEMWRKCRAANDDDRPSGWAFGGLEDLLLKRGHTFTRATGRPPIEPLPRACFGMSYHVANRRKTPWLYCEGYAIPRSTGLAMHHGWVVHRDRPTLAHDLAWEPGEAVYLGFIFDMNYVREVYRASGRRQYSVLTAYWIDCPLITGATALDSVTIPQTSTEQYDK